MGVPFASDAYSKERLQRVRTTPLLLLETSKPVLQQLLWVLMKWSVGPPRKLAANEIHLWQVKRIGC